MKTTDRPLPDPACITWFPALAGVLAAILVAGGAAGADRPAPAAGSNGPARVSRHNVVWANPSQAATGVMPSGNGDIAAGVYAIEDGELYLLLAKNDAFNFAGEIYKTGRVRVSLDPNPLKKGQAFRETLDLPTGSIQIEADGVRLSIWADANRPLIHVTIHSPRELAVTARPEFWERLDGTKDVRMERGGKLLWYFRFVGTIWVDFEGARVCS